MSNLFDKDTILKALQEGDIKLQGQFLHGSNYTYLGDLKFGSLKFEAVYKPTRGEQPLWDFPTGTLAKREVAAYIVSEALRWELIPPTVYRSRNMPMGPGSLQQFVDHDPEYHYFNFNDKDKQRLRPVALLDLVINNADRKGGHILIDERDHLWLIDHGICFNEDPKLRTVVWDFSGEKIPGDLLADIRCLAENLEGKGEVYSQLVSLLNPAEITALVKRARNLLEIRHFPYARGTRRPYPWPPI